MSTDWKARLESVRNEFDKAEQRNRPLYYTAVIGAGDGSDLLKRWDTILPPGTRWKAYSPLGGIMRFCDSPVYGHGQIHCGAAHAEYASDELQRLRELGRAAFQALDGSPYITGELNLPQVSEVGAMWIGTLHDIAETATNQSGLLRVERFRMLRAAHPDASDDAHEKWPVDKPIPKGIELLFPHDEVRRLHPDLFRASALAIDELLRGQTCESWSSMMQMKCIAVTLDLKPTARRRDVEPRLEEIGSSIKIMKTGGYRVRLDGMDATYRAKFEKVSG